MSQVYIRFYLLIALTLGLFPTLSFAAAKPEVYVEGKDYLRLPSEVRNSPDIAQLLLADPDKVQVVFFFNYGCHGCKMFNGPFQKWSKSEVKKYKDKIAVYKYPVSFNPQWKMLAKLYYTMEVLDPSGSLNEEIFDGVHKQHLKLWQEPVMKNFFVQHGYTADQFDKAFNSFGVDMKMNRANEISNTYKIIVTPDIIVNGPHASYRLELSKADNNVDKFFKILDYLVNREIKLLKS